MVLFIKENIAANKNFQRFFLNNEILYLTNISHSDAIISKDKIIFYDFETVEHENEF